MRNGKSQYPLFLLVFHLQASLASLFIFSFCLYILIGFVTGSDRKRNDNSQKIPGNVNNACGAFVCAFQKTQAVIHFLNKWIVRRRHVQHMCEGQVKLSLQEQFKYTYS